MNRFFELRLLSEHYNRRLDTKNQLNFYSVRVDTLIVPLEIKRITIKRER